MLKEKLEHIATETNTRLAYNAHLFALEHLLQRISHILLEKESLEFVFRGSLILRNWVFPHIRIVNDLDILGLIPLDLNICKQIILDAVYSNDNSENIIFNIKELEVKKTWEHTEFPGARIILPYSFLGINDEIQIDFGFDDTIFPAPIIMNYKNITREQYFQVPTVPVEVALAWKVHGLFEFWDQGGNWTPKTLYDIHLILSHLEINKTIFQTAILTAFRERKTPLHTYNRILNQQLGRSKGSRKSWKKFLRRNSIKDISENHIEIIEKHRIFLDPFFIDHI